MTPRRRNAANEDDRPRKNQRLTILLCETVINPLKSIPPKEAEKQGDGR